MASFNKVILVGNLCKDPEIRYTGSGTAVLDLRIAVTTKRKAGDETLFTDVTVWDKQAENCCKYLNKGSGVLVEGRLVLQEWEDKDTGQKRSKISVTAQNVNFLGGRESSGEQLQQPQPQLVQAPAKNASDDIPF